jgi:4-alpha-glucanotransferase
LIGILALESHRHRCLVVGEDLGTVPEGFRECITKANILSYRVLFFEQEANGTFLPPAAYPTLALSVLGNHDLSTLRGWWEGHDLELRRHLGFLQHDEFEDQLAERARQREQLVTSLRKAGLLPRGDAVGDLKILGAAHRFLARTPSMLAMAQLDDLTEETAPVNIPGTSDEHPNWRRKHSIALEELSSSRAFLAVVKAFNVEREHARTERSPSEPPPAGTRFAGPR